MTEDARSRVRWRQVAQPKEEEEEEEGAQHAGNVAK